MSLRAEVFRMGRGAWFAMVPVQVAGDEVLEAHVFPSWSTAYDFAYYRLHP